MICYKQAVINDTEEYKTAKEIGELYSVKHKRSRYGSGQKISAYIRKYIKDYNVEYEELYKKCSDGSIQLLYPKSIYIPAMERYCVLYPNDINLSI